ncbi:hypothetical protein ES288_D08G085400v1 [Gossypium darwinii]|uniref:Phenazine biosynthesis-like domain-containing protein 1 isoform X2 n=2 Tax=Gossypium TaxID=3633 RepID=A0ABM3ALP8_GOSHI|nr:phenazine biosynthesis-like domain-containing protein 1 isoform X2 [Gossypium hirsutum]TYG56714.1 hypothetical protein ES288_D08G085400v1 [Gossypium darwinii]
MAASTAAEFKFSETCYLTRIPNFTSPNPKFCLRWFTPVTEVKLCGHVTLASAHTLFTTALNGGVDGCFLIELNFPTVPVTNFNSAEASLISKALNDAPLIDVKRTTTDGDIFVIPQ